MSQTALSIFEEGEERLEFEERRGMKTLLSRRPTAPSIVKPDLEDLLKMNALLLTILPEETLIISGMHGVGTWGAQFALLSEVQKSVVTPHYEEKTLDQIMTSIPHTLRIMPKEAPRAYIYITSRMNSIDVRIPSIDCLTILLLYLDAIERM
ncbi:hypothetical protein Ferp_1193 [Ferroglobus placidus DSM 10642]|uniref:Uncharacterized protein n=1 Tax=Ferroglobus placidus (strain DSM 10642 / AEDII12DO) TaxID=589924 RepID=D3RXY8_FERPA|nr:hypothetical protein [Ferroglobus placidus]ADC65351.1 hypothetical protein Ferp_1193 [Ferroglobus placidus DSM 10642]